MRYLSALVALAALLAFAAACGDDEETATPAATTPAATTAAPTTPAATTPAATPAVCAPNPDPAPADIVQVDQPSPGDTVESPVRVSGRIIAFEATYQVAIYDAQGSIISQTYGMAQAPEAGQPGTFSQGIGYLATERMPACIWVYEASARDGQPIHVVQIPVYLEPSESVCQPNPDPAPPDFGNVTAPAPGDSVASPLTVTGAYAAFEAVMRSTLFDAGGNVIADQHGVTSEGQTLAPFSLSLPFAVSGATPSCLWVYADSANDGSPINVVQVPVTLLP